MKKRLRRIGLAALAVALCVPSTLVVIATATDGVPASVVARNKLEAAASRSAEKVAAPAADSPAKGSTANAAHPEAAVAGRDGWVFYGDAFNENFSQATGARRYSKDELATWAQSISQQQKWLAKRGIPLVFVVAPAKWSIYPDKAPEDANVDVEHIFEQIVAAYPKLPIIDVRQPLRDGRSVADTYSKLNGHWTDFGAYLVWKYLASKLKASDPSLAPPPPPAYSSVQTRNEGNEFADTLGANTPNSWTYPVLTTPLPQVQIVNADGSTKTVPGDTQTDQLDMPREVISPSAANPSRVLAFCDSTCRSLSPYLQASYASTIQVRHYIDQPEKRPSVPYLVDSYKPGLVMYVMTERNFNNVLADGPMWAAANAYDEASPETVGSWTPSDASPTLTLTGAPSETSPATIKWPRKSGAVDIVRLDVEAKGSGQLELQLTNGGKKETVPVQYAVGQSELFYALPKAEEGMTTALALAPGSADAQIVSVTVRRAA